MAGSDWFRPNLGPGSFDPHERRPEKSLILGLARDRAASVERQAVGTDAGGILSLTYVRPDGEGRHIVTSPRGGGEISIPSNGSLDGFAPGQSVLSALTREGWAIIGNPVSGEAGKNLASVASVSGTTDLFGIDRADPDEIAPGDTQSTTFHGFGFSASPLDSFTAVIWNTTTLEWDVDTEVTISAVTYVSDTEVTADVTVGAAASPRFIAVDMERG